MHTDKRGWPVQGGPHSRRPVCGLLDLQIWCTFNSFSLSISFRADYYVFN